jgi:hypothetical protein
MMRETELHRGRRFSAYFAFGHGASRMHSGTEGGFASMIFTGLANFSMIFLFYGGTVDHRVE